MYKQDQGEILEIKIENYLCEQFYYTIKTVFNVYVSIYIFKINQKLICCKIVS